MKMLIDLDKKTEEKLQDMADASRRSKKAMAEFLIAKAIGVLPENE